MNLSSARLPMPKDLLPLQTRENMLKSTSEFLARNSSGLPLDPEQNMGVYTGPYFGRQSLGLSSLKVITKQILSFFRFGVVHIRKRSVG